ncbi:MAG: carbohydrate ABC transporter permease [Anaerolineae bacterium]|jgi:ABC-type glycerol-3-phosphate transport system permease component
MANSDTLASQWSGLRFSQHKRILTALVVLLLAVYSLVTIFPFYVLFIRTCVGTKDATDLHLWIPPSEEVNLDAEVGNLSVFYNLDLKEFKEDLGLPPTTYFPARMTLRQLSEKYDIPPQTLEKYFALFGTFNGWIVLFKGGKIWPPLIRTLLVTAISVVGVNVLSICTGYALRGLRDRDQMIMYNLFLLQAIVPPMLIILPQFIIVQWLLGFVPTYDTPGFIRYAAQLMIIVLINIKGGALSTMIFTSSITAIPKELEESAEIDGASPLQYIFYVLLPLLKVPIAALTVVYLPSFWNLFLQPYVYLDTENATLLPFIQHFSGQNTTNFQAIYTTIFVSILPLVLIYLMFRRWFVRGALAGAIKG